MKKSNILRNVVAVAICLAVTISVWQPASAQTPKEKEYASIHTQIEKAKAETDYEKKLNPYSVAIMVRGLAIRKNIISCSDTEMAKVDAEMLALEANLWEIYNNLKSKTSNTPAKYEACQQIFDEKQEQMKGVPMPKTYALGNDLEKRATDMFKSKGYQAYCEGIGTFVKIVFLSEWEEIIGRENDFPFKILTHFNQVHVGIIVKVAGEEVYRMYNTYRMTQNYNSNGGLTNTYDFTDGGGKELFIRVQYKP